MKKLLSVILTLAMLCACCLTAAAETESAAGTWCIQTAQLGEQVINAADVGVSMTLTLLQDGTASVVAANNSEEMRSVGTWSQTGADVLIVLDDDPASCTIEDGVLYITEASTGLLFVLTRDVPTAAGTWYFTHLTYADYTTTSTRSGLDMKLVLNEDGTASSVTVSGLTEKETFGTWQQNDTALTITLDGEERTGFISDDAIILGNQDAGEKVLRFSRVAPLGVYFVPVAAEDATISDYIGEWSCQYAHLGTKLVSLAALDGAAELTVTPLMANMYIRDTSDSETATNHAISLSDGALLLGSAAAPDYTLQLLADGTVMCRLESGVTYYFQNTAN